MKKGFTLIELLVVVSIVSMLSSIVLAGTALARTKSRDTVRAEQIRQIINAFQQYRIANNTFPGSNIGISSGNVYGATMNTYCLGLNDGKACWEHGGVMPDPHYPSDTVATAPNHVDASAYAAAYGNTALANALAPYISTIPKDPLGNQPTHGDYYMYRYQSDTQHSLEWAVETCTPDSVKTCFGGTVSKDALTYGYGCQYECTVDLENVN